MLRTVLSIATASVTAVAAWLARSRTLTAILGLIGLMLMLGGVLVGGGLVLLSRARRARRLQESDAPASG